MENSLRELFFSKDRDDIHLACIIARKTNVNPSEVDAIDTHRRQEDRHYYRRLVGIMHQYLESERLNDERWQYYKWKEENDEPTDKGTTTE